jgi:hypothetical protein
MSPWSPWVRRKQRLSSALAAEALVDDPELRTLRELLVKCPIAPDELPRVLRELVRPPLSLGQNLAPDPEMMKGYVIELNKADEFDRAKFVRKKRVFDRETAEILMRLSATGVRSRRARYMQAKRHWEWNGKNHGLSISQQGRTPEVDSALVFYGYRLLLDSTGASKIEIGRPHGGGAVRTNDPSWRVLVQALPLAQRFLEFRFGAPARRPPPRAALKTSSKACRHEAIAEILLIARSKHFEEACRKCGVSVESAPNEIARNPFPYRAAFYYARVNARNARANTRPQRPVRPRHGSF